MSSIVSVFEQGGGLSGTLSHFELRPGQVELVKAIEKAVDNKNHLVAEAGTGIGKTFAYLLPTLTKKKKVFVSTATKHLQEQIYFKDLPIIEKILGRRVSACLLKGRGNYICRYRFEALCATNGLSKTLRKKLNKIRKWLDETSTGDLGEIAEFSEDDSGLLSRISSTAEKCLTRDCGCADDCFVQKAREKAKKCEMVVVNHALLMADIMLKETGYAEILPDVDVVVIDEAHHLPKIATQAFADHVTSGQLAELARDARASYRQDAGDMPDFEDSPSQLIHAIKAFNESLCAHQAEGQIQLGELKQIPKAYKAFQQMMQAMKPVLEGLSQLAERSDDLEAVNARGLAMANRIRHIFTPPKPADSSNPTASSPDAPDTPVEADPDQPAAEVENVADAQNNPTKENQTTTEAVTEAVTEKVGKVPASVALLEWGEGYFRASRLPIELDGRFRQAMHCYADSWLFVSATLALGDSFTHFNASLGLPFDIETLIVSSPYDYQKNAVIHVPAGLPPPNAEGFVDALVDNVLPIIEKTRGRTFMLFTSYRNLRQATERMQDTDFNLFVQGDMPKSQLIDAFIKSDNAVLLGTVSFWEGVDVHGEKLCCVVIDKIPFPSPADPIIAEQSRHLEEQGKNSFVHCYIPQAATLLKQGAGRLIRSQRDKGVLIFGDTRLVQKSYGAQLLNALPPASRVDRASLEAFVERELCLEHMPFA
ncbi:MAG: hypothetical protein CR974_00835 [Gammaproteobacteria bacterium]|nr:MAG: hypothetical protein CR974_00835 [Gammaproteobacteria bacterium]